MMCLSSLDPFLDVRGYDQQCDICPPLKAALNDGIQNAE
ncbi:hypothetical protein NPIL_491561, partial [Nephila pilipes]